MSNGVIWTQFTSNLTVFVNNEQRVIDNSSEIHGKLLKALKEDKPAEEIIEIINSVKEYFTGVQGVEIDESRGVVTIDGDNIPAQLQEVIMMHRANEIPFDYLVAFFRKLQGNPSKRSCEMLFDFLQHHHCNITTEGNFIGYKGIRNDWKDAHSGTIDNSLGTEVRIPRNKVDDDPKNTCSHGLHIGAFEYASTFSQRTVMVEIDPADVVAVPYDYDGQKMRVCAYKVIKEIERPEEQCAIVDTSTNSPLFDEDDWGYDDDSSSYYNDEPDPYGGY